MLDEQMTKLKREGALNYDNMMSTRDFTMSTSITLFLPKLPC